MKLSVCIATYQRPEGLAALLEGLAHLSAPVDTNVEVVIVDNDAQGSAAGTCDWARQSLRWPLRYSIEPRPGIPFARNACLRASTDSDLVAFIDDDEVPAPEWLSLLTGALLRYDADVVTGPVCYRLSPGTSTWIERSGAFDRRSHPTGSRRRVAYTHNVLFRRRVLDGLTPWFDERRAFAGGSDSHFFRRAHAAGARIIWVDEALVYETVPSERATLRWVLERAFRVGSNLAWSRNQRFGALRALPMTLLSTSRFGVRGGFEAVRGALRGGADGKQLAVRGLRHMAYAMGGAFGELFSHQPYSRQP